MKSIYNKLISFIKSKHFWTYYRFIFWPGYLWSAYMAMSMEISQKYALISAPFCITNIILFCINKF